MLHVKTRTTEQAGPIQVRRDRLVLLRSIAYAVRSDDIIRAKELAKALDRVELRNWLDSLNLEV